MADWIKCHKALTRGPKRGLPRATRFVYLELCLEARELDGVVPVRTDVPIVEALHDLIGGNRTEVAAAWLELVAAGMVELDQATVVIVGWDTWAKADSSTERVRRYRAKERGNVSAFPMERARGEESREEEKREEERARAPVPPLSEKAQQVLQGLLMGADIFPDEPAMSATAARIEQALSFEPRAGQLDRRQVGAECVQHARAWAAKFPLAEPAQRLAEAERKVGWLLRDVRAGKVAARPLPEGDKAKSDSDLMDDARESAAKLDREQAQRAARARDRPPADTRPLGAAISKLKFMRPGGLDGVEKPA